MEIAVTNTDRLARLINDILDIGRIESGQAAMEKQICQDPDVMDQAAELMRDMAESSGIALETSPAQAWAALLQPPGTRPP